MTFFPLTVLLFLVSSVIAAPALTDVGFNDAAITKVRTNMLQIATHRCVTVSHWNSFFLL